MKERWKLLVMVVFVGLAFLTVGALTGVVKSAEEPTKAPDEVIINSKGYKEDKKPPVVFDHKKHVETFLNVEGKKIECTECHHRYVDGKNMFKEGDPVKKCDSPGCHNPLKTEGKILKLQLAFHRNCKDCHKDVVKAVKEKKRPPYKTEPPYKKCEACMKTK
jgi:hypothetical protein